MRLISWNVNGIRSVARKGFLEFLAYESPDALCLQEVKAIPDEVDEVLKCPYGYKSFWFPAKKKGYSGVTTYTKTEPSVVTYGIGDDRFDSEGRVLCTEFKNFILINAYFPNSQRDHARLTYKVEFCYAMLEFCERLRQKKKNIVICGDFNIAHKEIDLRNPKTNQQNAGFLPEERAFLDLFVAQGYVDVFREFCQDPHHYTWWSYRSGVREKNIGWRIDYHFVNREFFPFVKKSCILPDVMGSDHCPVVLELS